MGSTYLHLTNLVLKRLNEVELTSTNFAGARGIHADVKAAVNQTIQQINTQKFEWPFNSATGTQVLTIDENFYSWPADFKTADWESFYIEKDDTLITRTKRLRYIGIDEWYYKYRDNDFDASPDGLRVPDCVFESTSGGFGVTKVPDKAYTVKYTYFKISDSLVADDDTTDIPTQFDYIIENGALASMYGHLDNNPRFQNCAKMFEDGVNYMSFILIPKRPYVRGTVINQGGGPWYSKLGGLGYAK